MLGTIRRSAVGAKAPAMLPTVFAAGWPMYCERYSSAACEPRSPAVVATPALSRIPAGLGDRRDHLFTRAHHAANRIERHRSDGLADPLIPWRVGWHVLDAKGRPRLRPQWLQLRSARVPIRIMEGRVVKTDQGIGHHGACAHGHAPGDIRHRVRVRAAEPAGNSPDAVINASPDVIARRVVQDPGAGENLAVLRDRPVHAGVILQGRNATHWRVRERAGASEDPVAHDHRAVLEVLGRVILILLRGERFFLRHPGVDRIERGVGRNALEDAAIEECPGHIISRHRASPWNETWGRDSGRSHRGWRFRLNGRSWRCRGRPRRPGNERGSVGLYWLRRGDGGRRGHGAAAGGRVAASSMVFCRAAASAAALSCAALASAAVLSSAAFLVAAL